MSMGVAIGVGAGVIVLILLLFGLSGLRVVYQYQRVVIFILGRLIGAKGPGVFWVPPFISQTRTVDLRVVTIELPPQEGVTRDNVTVKVSAVLYFYIVNPNDAINNVQDYFRATVQIAQTTLRSTLGQSTLDQLLSDREVINHSVQTVIDERTERWGIKVTAVEVKDVELPQTMQRAMAKQAEAEREKRAKDILAQGEFLAAQTLADAAKVIATEPAALQLRYLQTMTEIAVEKNSTIVFPLPLDLIEPLLKMLRRAAGSAEQPLAAPTPTQELPSVPASVPLKQLNGNDAALPQAPTLIN